MKQLVSQKRIGIAVVSTLFLAILSCNSFPIRADQTDVEAESAKTWVGKKVQPFSLPGVNGKTVNIAENLGKRPVVLVFYRGVW
jgi:hypothetical protein